MTMLTQQHNQTGAAEPDSPLPVRFDDYEIHGVRSFGRGKRKYCEQVPDEEAQFWSLFGHMPGQGLECIGDFESRALAEEIFSRITGRRYQPDSTGKVV